MKKKVLLFVTMFVFALVAKAQYQYPNSDFESEFVSAYPSKGFTEPMGWHGYATISGGVGSLGRSGSKLVASDDVHEGSMGSQSVCVTATSIWTIIANGVMTNGQIYSGSMSATDGSGNYNFSDQTNTGDSDTYGDNDKFFTSFTGRPDYMNVWLKFVPAAEDKGNARVSVYLHKDGTVMYDPTDNVEDMSIVVAHAEESIPTNDGAWTLYSIPFDYDGDGQYDGTATPAMILATFSTNETPGVGTKGDSLYIDDIEMVYLSELQSATYDGEAIPFIGDAASVDAEYDATLLECIADGAGATIELDEPMEDNGYVLTITVKGDNISEDESNYHTYTVQFASPEVEEVETITYTDELLVTVNDETLDPMETSVTVEFLEDGNINFVLNNFVLDMEGTSLAVGNIEVDGIELNEVAEGEEYQTFSFDGTIRITRGDLEGVTMWWGPMLGDVPIVMEGKITDEKLYVTISISLSTLGMDIEVVFGSDFESEEEPSVEPDLALYATYDGVELTDGAVIEGAYDADKLEVTAGEGAMVATEYDDATQTLTITVTAEDGSESKTYTVTFSAPKEEEVETITYTDELLVTVNDETLDPMETSVTVEFLEDGNINFVLNNFVLDMEGTSLAVGNIEVDGIELNEVAEGEEYQTFSFDGTIRITRGDLEGVTMWWGPMLGDVPIVMEGKITDEKLYVTISISLSTLGMDIEVVFGSDFESEEEPSVEPDLALYATYDGVELTDGAVIEGAYDADKLEVTAGEGAMVATEYDDATQTLTITVTAEDGSESKTYTITFTIATGIKTVTATTEDESLYDLMGRPVSGKAQRGIYVQKGKKVLIK